MMPSANPGRSSATTSISPYKSEQDSFSHTDTHAPLKLVVNGALAVTFYQVLEVIVSLPTLPRTGCIPNMCGAEPDLTFLLG